MESAKRRPSEEARLIEQARSFRDPMSRKVFLKLAGAAGATSLLALYGAGCGGSDSSTGGEAAGQQPPSPDTGAGTAAASPPATEIERGIIGEQIHTLANDFFVNFDAGAQQMAQALGLDIRVMEHEGNVSTQLSQIQDLKNQGANMLFGNVATEGVLPRVARAAEQAGIYYSNVYDIPAWFTPPDVGDHYILYTTPPSEPVAYELAKLLFEEIGGAGAVIHVPAIPGASADIQRTAGFERALQEYPDITVHTAAPGNWNRIDARKSFADAIQAVPDFAGVFAQNDSEAVGVLSVLEERGIQGKPVTGVDGNKESILLVAKGDQLATHATVGGYHAALNAIHVFDALNGWKPSIPERMIYIQSILITQENAQEFYDVVYGSAELPFDWELMSKALHPDDWDPQSRVEPINPRTHWEGFPEQDYTLNAAYDEAIDAGEFETVTQLYADHYKAGPFKQFETP